MAVKILYNAETGWSEREDVFSNAVGGLDRPSKNIYLVTIVSNKKRSHYLQNALCQEQIWEVFTLLVLITADIM